MAKNRTLTYPNTKRAYLTADTRQHVVITKRSNDRTIRGWAKASGDRSTFIFKSYGGAGRPRTLARNEYDLAQVIVTR